MSMSNGNLLTLKAHVVSNIPYILFSFHSEQNFPCSRAHLGEVSGAGYGLPLSLFWFTQTLVRRSAAATSVGL